MFATKCTYIFEGTERMAKEILRRIKNDPHTLRARLKSVGENKWVIPCEFAGKGVPLMLRNLIKRKG